MENRRRDVSLDASYWNHIHPRLCICEINKQDLPIALEHEQIVDRFETINSLGI